MRNHSSTKALAVATLFSGALCLPLAAQRVAPDLAPSPLPEMAYDVEFFPGANDDPAVPTVEKVLGFREGARAATTTEVNKCLDAWAAASARVRVVEYARTHEGRPLHYVIISDPANLTRLDAIKSGLAKLADPRTTTTAEADKLINTLPGVAWLAYTIHGDETEGTDAALAVIHHLAAARDEETTALLRDVVVLVDPVENPDGRDRFLKMVAEARGAHPNVDEQSLVHTGYSPYGRANHYGFDMNRDWIYGTQPETRGRWSVITAWNPQLVVDSHGMEPQASFLFSPPREPLNPYYPAHYARWAEIFGREHGEAFDKHGWTYYAGEWNEGWYPSYADAWPALRGAVGLLFEQARMADDGIRRAEGTIESYREAVHGNVVGSMSSLATFRKNMREILRDFHEHRAAALDPKGPFASRSWAILPTGNNARLRAFTSCLSLQGVEFRVLDKPEAVKTATDQLGNERKDVSLSAGTIVIPNRQPLGHLVADLLEFDPHIPEASLKFEREKLLKNGATTIYDSTAWNFTMLFGLDALEVPVDLGGKGAPGAVGPEPAAASAPVASAVGWLADGADDSSVVFAARLMEQGVRVRVADKAFALDGEQSARGSVVVTQKDNRLFAGDLAAAVARIAGECGVAARAIRSGFGPGELPDLGGGHFNLLERPRVAILARGGASETDFGSIWHLLDHTLAIRNSQLNADDSGFDLRRYNVIVVPSRYETDPGFEAFAKSLRPWIEAGGTLIAIKGSAEFFASEKSGIGSARTLPAALEDVEPYRQQVLREWLAAGNAMPAAASVWSRDVPAELSYPWPAEDKDGPDAKELKRRDAWQQTFMPQGAILAARVDTENWLTFGCGAVLPVFATDDPVILAPSGVESPVRYGVFENVAPADGDPAIGPDISLAGWSPVPAGHKIALRMSGLLWPEAAQRLANSAYLTREQIGSGQLILFSGEPTFRAAALGTERLLMNAIVYGPGMGASHPILP